MPADTGPNTGAEHGASDNRDDIISRGGNGRSHNRRPKEHRFRPGDWLQRWAGNGNSAGLTPSGGLYLGYDIRPDRSRRASERIALEMEVRPHWSVVASHMRRTGLAMVGAQL